MAAAVRDGKLVIPISEKLPLGEAAEAQAAAERAVSGRSCWWPDIICKRGTQRKIGSEKVMMWKSNKPRSGSFTTCAVCLFFPQVD